MSSDRRPESAADPSPEPSDVESTTARYLYAISTHAVTTDERVTTGELTEYLDVAPASVTEQVAKLDERGLVDHEKYRGVRLTDRGEVIASRIAWQLCIVTSFFESVVDTSLDEGMAIDIGLTLPEDGVSRLRERIETACLDICPESGRQDGHCLA